MYAPAGDALCHLQTLGSAPNPYETGRLKQSITIIHSETAAAVLSLPSQYATAVISPALHVSAGSRSKISVVE